MKFRMEIIRHGDTDATNNHIYCGFTDLPLNAEGIERIEENVRMGIYKDADTFYTSGMKRAVETLGIIAGEVEWSELPGLKECNFGDFEGHTHESLLENEEYLAWINDTGGNYVVPNGESTNMFNARVDAAFTELFDRVAQSGAHSAMLVSHGGPIARFYTTYIDDKLNMYEAMPKRGEGYSVLVDYVDGAVNIIGCHPVVRKE